MVPHLRIFVILRQLSFINGSSNTFLSEMAVSVYPRIIMRNPIDIELGGKNALLTTSQ